MGRGERLNERQIHTILKLSEEPYSVTKISKVVNRSRKVIINLLKNPENHGKKKGSGRPQSLTARQKHAILRTVSNSSMTALQIAESVGVNTNVKNVRRVLQKCKHLMRRKLQKKPWLKKERKRSAYNLPKSLQMWEESGEELYLLTKKDSIWMDQTA
ncbi:uncharacterized protein LOC143361560 [Halictus rubicundus]|uniref:uncharacterized protein LOC143361560 n=1 Tax=Halictus rubicundus TaxID=77578 RepID=UPI00403601A4